jgi:hypothetical protein
MSQRDKGKSEEIGSLEERQKKLVNSISSEQSAKAQLKLLSRDEKKSISIENVLEEAKAKDKEKLTTLADINAIKKKATDKPLNISAFKKILKSIHRALVFIPNMDLQYKNKAGHMIFFQSPQGLISVCGIGNACNYELEPETKLGKDEKGNETIISRGWLAAIDMTFDFLKANHIPFENKNI